MGQAGVDRRVTAPSSSRALTIWVVSDGRAGIENQALGLAEAVERLTPAEIAVKHVRWRPLFDRLPSAFKTPAMLAPTSDPLTAPWPSGPTTRRAIMPPSCATLTETSSRP
ncbi:MAG: hypothetical protein A2093_05520 [Caulobacterales bacterium GWE1_67_11]|nr:MAG: hypothetical protein A2093_05520 [Caulobacterales bacterium GWE1_67_11]